MMGCDIHLYVEKRIDGKWVTADKWTRDCPDEPLAIRYEDRFYCHRNYALFAILAGVRNYEDGYNSIESLPRGLPEDACLEVKQEEECWGGDGHSHSWLTLKELLQYNWEQKKKCRGFLNAEQFADLKTGKLPLAWHNRIPSQEVLEKREMEQALLDGITNVFCLTSWEQSYHDIAEEFCVEVLPKLQKLADNPEDVRIVFWFDN